ncbi:Gfo/Idh/MocA family protein [Phytohabitans houttuyneae]|uniref:Oxidoreductase n=1 Tax=Phytohabitans houttuyneae TaxID=1076126 RepID=A0A6V8KL20_9ACTN|nr:Gfo/Idh/MocA family oxidoreductase [Phytohabitans houttuyneae]GFJ85882.1 oxidoreductase [Phytohabitans houttuyneae]
MSDRIRAAIIGYGLAGRVFHAPLISADPAYELAGIVTANPDRSSAAATLYPQARIFSTVDDLLAADDIDLVVVGAPTPDHAAVATRTVECGLATVVDKPLAVRSLEAAELIELASLRGVPLTVFQNRRWDGDFLTVRKLLSQGALGDVWRFESRFEWNSTRPRPQWKQETPGVDGGGVAYDLGAHLIDQAVQLFGPVASYYGELDRHRPGAVNDDDSFIALTHTSGVRSHLAMSSMVAQRGFRFRVLGSTAAYTKWGLDPQEPQLAGGMSPLDEAFGVEPEDAWGKLGRDADATPLPTERGAYREFYAQLAASLRGGGPLPVDPRDALVAIGIIESLHTQQP